MQMKPTSAKKTMMTMKTPPPSGKRKRGLPKRLECDCGNPATVYRFGTKICTRCDFIDSNRPLDITIGRNDSFEGGETGLLPHKSYIVIPPDDNDFLDEDEFPNEFFT